MGALPHRGWWTAEQPSTNQSVLFCFSQFGYSKAGRLSWRWDRDSYVPHSKVSDGIATYQSVALW